MRYAYIDTETRSPIDLKKSGSIRYTEECTPLCVTWVPPAASVDELLTRLSECHLWECHHSIPKELATLLVADDVIWVAHNAMFERHVLLHGLDVNIPIERWRCTSALARYAGLPGALDQVGKRLDLPPELLKFDDSGGIDHFCKEYSKKFRNPEDDPERWDQFMAYAKQDTVTCKAVHFKLSKMLRWHPLRYWREREQYAYMLDQRINDQGFQVDEHMLDNALQLIQESLPVMTEEMAMMTNFEVTKLQSPHLRRYMQTEFMMHLLDLRRETVMQALEEVEDSRAKEILRLRLNGAKNSLAKYGRANVMVSKDGRIRGGYMYHGAHTGRWSGQGIQPQNLARPTYGLDPAEVGATINELWLQGADAVKARYPDIPIFDVLVSGLRGAIIAKPGHVLVMGDYNQIESRITAFGAGCERKLRAFREHDNGESELDPEVLGDKTQRQAGKTMDLGLGFGMGAAKFAKVAKLTDERAKELCYGWRDVFHEIPTFWNQMHKSFGQAILRSVSDDKRVWRNQTTKIATMELPSGKPLFYHRLRFARWRECIEYAEQFGNGDRERERMERVGAEPEQLNKHQLCYISAHGYRRMIHGGLIVENWVQATAREVMVEHALYVEDTLGYTPVLHSHDELVYEVPADSADRFAKLLTEIMSETPVWIQDLPLKAEVAITERYTK